jgi:hypothetical protein
MGTLRSWWRALGDTATWRARGFSPFCAGFLASWVRFKLVMLPAELALVAWAVAACSPSELALAANTLTALTEAAAEVHRISKAADEADEQRRRELLRRELPVALEKLDGVLAELCDPQSGQLPPDDKVCEHYRAYKADDD